ncbi:MAG: ATPase P, partial [Verrucomicrobiaceae bacterium]
YYDLQEGSIPPVKSSVFQQRDYDWLAELVSIAEREQAPVLQLSLQGISCIGCAWLVERIFARRPGGLGIRVDPSRGVLDLRWERGRFDVVAFARETQAFGYLVGPPGQQVEWVDRSLIIRLGLCGALAMNTMLFTLPSYLGMAADAPFAALFARLSLTLGTLSLLVGGSYFIVRSWRGVRQGILHIDLPISMGLIAAYLGSVYAHSRGAEALVYFDFVSTFTFLMLLGRWLQLKAVDRNRNHLLASRSEPPAVSDAVTGAKLSAQALTAGHRFLVEPGRVIPVRSRLHSDGATLSLEWINGESEARVANKGELVPSGSVNCSQTAVNLEALETWESSLLAELLRIDPAPPPRNLQV